MNYSVYYKQSGTCEKYNEKHFHNNAMEIVQIVSGKGTLLLGSIIRNFEPGDILVIDGTVIHCISPNDPEDYVRSKLVVDRNVFLQLCRKDFFKNGTLIKSDRAFFDQVDGLFKEINKNVNNNDMSLMALSDVFKLLHLCADKSDIRIQTKKGVVSDIMEYISNNINEDMTIDDISRHVHMSKFHICRKFKQETGLTINNYILSTRIYNARQLLAYTDKSISQIGEESGFPDSPTFTKTFKKIVGITPSSFRKKCEAWGNNKK